jgi:hypothetical protein
VKIIQLGQLAGEAWHRATCGICGTIYEFQAKEATLQSDQREGDNLRTACPANGCGSVNYTAVRQRSGSQWER